MADFGWDRRLREDRRRAASLQPFSLREIVQEVVGRAVNEGARAVALTGSTARGRRTAISDLDFHVIGSRPELRGLPGEIDIVADSLARFRQRLVEGDDFVQWTVRHGWVLHDPDRIFHGAYARIIREDQWPDPRRKFERADALAGLAERVLRVEDRDAAQEHLRAGLTSLARGLLLGQGIFPLARDELAEQLREIGQENVARWLSRCIHETLELEDLNAALRCMQRAHIQAPIGGLSEAA